MQKLEVFIFISLLLVLCSCSNNRSDSIKQNNLKFISENPQSKYYIDFLHCYKSKLLALDKEGFKLEWTLHVHCEKIDKHGGFRAKFYASEDKMRIDVLFIDGKKWIRIFDGKQNHDFINGERSNEFKDRWGDDPPERPLLEPIFAGELEWKNFRIDTIETGIKAYLGLIANDEKITLVFTDHELEEYSVIFHKKSFDSIYKISYGKDFQQGEKLLIPRISISEIPKSGWCNGGKRYVDKENYKLDFNWKPGKNTFNIKEPMVFLEKIEPVTFGEYHEQHF